MIPACLPAPSDTLALSTWSALIARRCAGTGGPVFWPGRYACGPSHLSRSPVRRCLLLLLWLATPIAAVAAAPADALQWRSGLTEINEGWTTHEGDDLRWAEPGFDDTSWKTVDIEDMGPRNRGGTGFGKHLALGPDRADARLLVSGGDGTYELFVNGTLIEGPRLKSGFGSRPTERVFPLSDPGGEFVIALR